MGDTFSEFGIFKAKLLECFLEVALLLCQLLFHLIYSSILLIGDVLDNLVPKFLMFFLVILIIFCYFLYLIILKLEGSLEFLILFSNSFDIFSHEVSLLDCFLELEF